MNLVGAASMIVEPSLLQYLINKLGKDSIESSGRKEEIENCSFDKAAEKLKQSTGKDYVTLQQRGQENNNFSNLSSLMLLSHGSKNT